MSIFSKHHVKVAANKRAKIDLSSKVVTTGDIGATQVVYCRECVPGDKWSINISSFSRLAPLPVPTFAQIRQVNRAFFVKYKDIWQGWEGFYTNTQTYVNGTSISTTVAPCITNAVWANALAGGTVITYSKDGSPISTPLFTTGTADDFNINFDGTYYKYTYYGKRVLTFLRGLGIQFNWSSNDTTPISILPVLAALKVHLDYYIPSKYYTDSQIRSIITMVESSKFSDAISSIINLVYAATLYYDDNDYFTASWDTPNNIGTNALQGTTSLTDVNITGALTQSIGDSNAQAYNSASITGNTSSLRVISQTSLNMLQSFYNWITRKNLSGNKYFEQILSQYGIKIPSHDDKRSYYLGGSVSTTQFGEVYSTASTDTSAVGDYAGKGVLGAKSNHISLDCEDFGCVVIMSTLVPEMGYVQGRNREWLHINRLDFFQPEFDCVGMQAIRKDEMMTCNNALNYVSKTVGSKTYNNFASTVLGYVPRYTEYRRKLDILNGDFALDVDKSQTLQAYHTFRLLDESDPRYSTMSQYFRRSDSFMFGLNRIFNYQKNDADHFICVFDINVSVKRKMKSITDAFDIDGIDTVTLNADNNL